MLEAAVLIKAIDYADFSHILEVFDLWSPGWCYHAGLPCGSHWDCYLGVIATSGFLQFLDDFMPTIHQQMVETSLNFLKDKINKFCRNVCCAPGVWALTLLCLFQVFIVESLGRRILLLAGFGFCCVSCAVLTLALNLQVCS